MRAHAFGQSKRVWHNPAMTIAEARPVEEPCSWIDTHCHLDAAEFDPDREAVIDESRRRGLKHIVIPAVDSHNFGAVAALQHGHFMSCLREIPRAGDPDHASAKDKDFHCIMIAACPSSPSASAA